jgi:hypothetical protein
MVSDDENIVNFARFRKISRDDKKRREKAEKDMQAAANRVKFGRSGVEKKLARLDRKRQTREHEGNRREADLKTPDPSPGGGIPDKDRDDT